MLGLLVFTAIRQVSEMERTCLQRIEIAGLRRLSGIKERSLAGNGGHWGVCVVAANGLNPRRLTEMGIDSGQGVRRTGK